MREVPYEVVHEVTKEVPIEVVREVGGGRYGGERDFDREIEERKENRRREAANKRGPPRPGEGHMSGGQRPALQDKDRPLHYAGTIAGTRGVRGIPRGSW